MNLLRLAGRLVPPAVALAGLGLIAAQYERIIERNVAVGHELASVRADVEALRQKQQRQLHEIKRLSDPRGAVPEIHDRLHLVGPDEELIYLKPAKPAVAPAAGAER